MNLQDRFAEMFLPVFDAFMNLITLGLWTRIQGNRIPDLKVVRK